MTDPYVPTTEEVRRRYRVNDTDWHREHRDPEFDRWLESLLATAGADGWDAGCRVGFEMHEDGYDEPQLQWNPHRADSMEGKAHENE